MAYQFHEIEDFGEGHDDANLLEWRAEAAAFAADPEVADDGNLKSAADAGAFDQGERRQRTVANGPQRAFHDLAVPLGAGGACPDTRKLGEIGTGAKCLAPGTPENDTAQTATVGGNLLHGFGQCLPHGKIERVQALRPIEGDGGDIAGSGDEHWGGHRDLGSIKNGPQHGAGARVCQVRRPIA